MIGSRRAAPGRPAAVVARKIDLQREALLLELDTVSARLREELSTEQQVERGNRAPTGSAAGASWRDIQSLRASRRHSSRVDRPSARKPA